MSVSKCRWLASLLVFGILCLLAFYSQNQAHADTIFVKEGATGSGTSWADATGDLRSVIDVASSGDQIWVTAGTYIPVILGQTGTRTDCFQLAGDIELYGGFPNAGSPTWTLRDPQIHISVLSGEILDPGTRADNCYHVVYARGESVSAVIDGFTIAGGNAAPKGMPSIVAFAQSISHPQNTSNQSFRKSTTATLNAVPDQYTFDGGGMLIIEGAAPTVNNCVFEDNSAGNYGGGLCNWNSSPTITNCDFYFNLASDLGGGGICNQASSPTIVDSYFIGNLGFVGGGIYNYGNSSPIISKCMFGANFAMQYGGGIENDSNCSPVITDSYFINNTANYGGAMECYDNCRPVIDSCVFSVNQANQGGGIALYNDSDLQLTNSILSRNFAEDDGGGIYIIDSSPTIVNCTVFENTAGPSTGGGFYIDGGIPFIANSIVWNNTSGISNQSLDEIHITSGKPTIRYNNVRVHPGSPAFPGIGNISGTPMFVDSGSGDFHLLPDSPCIDSGNNSAILQLGVFKDIDGNVRIINGTVDMGIHEYGEWTCLAYDSNESEKIEYSEMVDALMDYLTMRLSFPCMVDVLMCYLTG